jgi:hypothetical protein
MADLNWLNNIIFPKIIKDSGWRNSNTSLSIRGFHDYVRDIEFEFELSNHDTELFCKSLAKDPKCPGWTGVTGKRSSANYKIYRFYTTWDSSD